MGWLQSSFWGEQGGGLARLRREAEDRPRPPPQFCLMTEKGYFSSNKQINLEKYDLSWQMQHH